MDDDKQMETEQAAEETDAESTAEEEPAEDRGVWRAGLVAEALENRPELRKLASKQDFAASRRAGYDLGFEDGARKLTLDQLQQFQALLDRRMASYALHEMPGELRGYLDERATGLDERGFLAGYVDGVGDFLTAYRAQLRNQS